MLLPYPGGTLACQTWHACMQVDLAGEFGEGTTVGPKTALPQSTVADGARRVGDFPQQCGNTDLEQDLSCD